MSERLDKTIRVGALAATLVTVLAHGAVESWSLALFELMVVGLILLLGLKLLRDKQLNIAIPSTALPVAALLGLALIQSIAFTGSAGIRASLSLDVEATRATALALFSLLAMQIITANFFCENRHLRAFVSFLVIAGLGLALFAFVQHITWNGRFYWLRPVSAEVTTPFGPFVNRNHFAGYMELLIPLPLAMIVTRAASKDTRLFYVFAATMMAVAAIASLSRGGMISLAAELIFLGWLSVKNNANRRAQPERRGSKLLLVLHRSAFALLILAALTAGIIWTGPERIIDRIAHTTLANDAPQAETFFTSRGWIWRDTLAIISANSIFGVGLGAYETAYPNYSQADGAASLGVSYTVDRAHNDYLQALADGGIIGGAIVCWLIVAIFRAVFRGLNARNPLHQAFAMGGGAGLFGLLVHSAFDFNLQIPSNALLFLMLAGLVAQLTAASQSREQAQAAHRRVAEPVTDFAFDKGVTL